jgi:benzoyl-CoA reductase subunit C
LNSILAEFAHVAAQPLDYARRWKQQNARQVIGIFPMHFPGELAHAAGALPVILQEDNEPVTIGQAGVFSFYCGYNRSIVDQAMRGEFDDLDAIMFGDHCVQLLGTADVIRGHKPDLPILFNQLCSILDAKWVMTETQGTFRQLWKELEELTGANLTTGAVQTSIRLFNKNRALIRKLYDLRRSSEAALTGRQMQDIVKSSMIMDKADHTALLEKLHASLTTQSAPSNLVRVYLSGHMCHAPKPEILDMVEECGGLVVDDDLYHGFRYIHYDMAETGDPIDALSNWYIEKNRKLPCPTRVTQGMDWQDYLLNAVATSGAQGLVILMAKFCEPHMFFYPEIKEAFDRHGIPNLMIETEHEEMPMESLKTRVETFIEIARRRAAA